MEKKKAKFLGMLAVRCKGNLDVTRELPNLSNAKMFSCVQNFRDSLLENYSSYSGQFISIKLLFYGFFGHVLPEDP